MDDASLTGKMTVWIVGRMPCREGRRHQLDARLAIRAAPHHCRDRALVSPKPNGGGSASFSVPFE
jgi:hypothetical protein